MIPSDARKLLLYHDTETEDLVDLLFLTIKAAVTLFQICLDHETEYRNRQIQKLGIHSPYQYL